MQTNILEYLENTASQVPDKMAYSNGVDSVTFGEVLNRAKSIGTYLLNGGYTKEPVVVFMDRHPNAVVAFFGVVYSGCYYVPLDNEMPQHRIGLILQNLKPRMIICDESTLNAAKEFDCDGKVVLYSDMIKETANEQALAAVREKALDIDPIYIVFTSGSTGVPKGVIACHRSVIDYMENLTAVLRVTRDTVFGMQSPLYFDACLKELYSSIKCGSSAYLVPKPLFMQPVKLVEYLNDNKVNTICWVVSALTLISGLGTFKEIVPKYLHTVAFGSEVFPIKQFRKWKEVLPNARFINLYGPTEATGMSCYYEVNREFGLDDAIPIGRPFKNTEILLITDDNKAAAPGEPGEICIRGTAVTMGYYNEPEKTSAVFTQNPLNKAYPEIIYRTGDIAKYNEYGELMFISRKDYQIKHMGHRIELGEIELIVNMSDGIALACCIFDDVKKKIVLYYTGSATPAETAAYIREKLPVYMLPSKIEKLEEMPLTPNGKINRKYLKELYMNK